MKLNPKTFCAAPWFQVRQNMDGSFKSCCAIRQEQSSFEGKKYFESFDEYMQSDYLQHVKQNLHQGNQIQDCNICWAKEKSGIKSLRNCINESIASTTDIEKSWLYFYFKNKKDYKSDLFLSADIKTTNVCNFSCAMCIPNDSSKIHAVWKKSKSHPLVSQVLDNDPKYLDKIDLIYREGQSYKLLKQILQKKPMHLKLLGGEPLLDKMLLDILDKYNHKSFTNLLFVTNGSVDFTEIAYRYKDYKSVNLLLSLEGVNSVQDYVRRGSNWHMIKQNVQNYIKNFGTDNFSVNHTLQALTLNHLPDLIKWSDELGIILTIAVLKNPRYLSFSSMPPDLMNKALENLKKSDANIQRLDENEQTSSVTIDNLLNLIKEDYEYNSDHTDELRIFLDWYDPDQNWKHILPEWLPYID